MINTFSKQNSITQAIRVLHPHLFLRSMLQTINKHVQSQLIRQPSITKFNLQLPKMCHITLNRTNLMNPQYFATELISFVNFTELHFKFMQKYIQSR